MRSLCPFLSQWRHEDGREREKDHSAQKLQRVNGPFDERKRPYIEYPIFKYQYRIIINNQILNLIQGWVIRQKEGP